MKYVSEKKSRGHRTSKIVKSNHREHTILLSRERVNKGTKRINILRLSPYLIAILLGKPLLSNPA